MKKLILSFILFFGFLFITSNSIQASYVKGYFKSNGTYVQGYYRANPNGLKYDNYSYTYTQPRYNNSYYYPTKNYGTNWTKPSYTYQKDYWTGYNYYNSNR